MLWRARSAMCLGCMPETKTVEQIVNELLKIRLGTDFRDIERLVSAPWTSIGTPLIRAGEDGQAPSSSCNADGGRLAPSPFLITVVASRQPHSAAVLSRGAANCAASWLPISA